MSIIDRLLNNFSENEFSFNKIVDGIRNNPNLFLELLNSLGYDIVEEEIKEIYKKPIYKTRTVTKTRTVSKSSFCGVFGVFPKTEYYNEEETYIAGYEDIEETKSIFKLKKIKD